MDTFSPVKRASIEVTVTRADGTVQHYGCVADSRWWWRFGLPRLLAHLRTRRLNKQALAPDHSFQQEIG